jgi:hypothetical protein
MRTLSLCLMCTIYASGMATAQGVEIPEVPRIDSVVMAKPQPHETSEAVIWYDDFDGKEKNYPESGGGLDEKQAFGGRGKSMLCLYEKGSRGIGSRKVFFGDSPAYKPVNPGKQYDDIYWRIYVKHQYGWTGGGPAKLSRATSLVSSRWAQAMIAHVWSSGEALTLDPATGVRGDKVVTRKYNDFEMLKWLGNRPTSKFRLHSTEKSGRWVCVEARAKLNTPGQKDGLNQLWIDGKLEAERRNLDWRGSYTDHGINAVFLEAYWNSGSPVTQSRWIDNFIISTEPIGPVVCSRNPVLIKTPYRGPGEQQAWEAEVAIETEHVVWRSNTLTESERIRIGEDTGSFLNQFSGKDGLDASHIYYVRVRQQSSADIWSDWSEWHQPFQVE